MFLLHPFEIKLADKVAGSIGDVVPNWIQYARVGTFNHPDYGHFEITPLTLSEFKQNFENNVRRVDPSIDYFHENDKIAAGWIKEFQLRENDTQLWVRVEWTPSASKKLAEKELRYFSPEFRFDYVDPETLQEYKNVVFGGGLTNRPFIKDMDPITLAEQKKEKEMNEKELKAKIAELETANVKLSEQVGALQPKADKADAMQAKAGLALKKAKPQLEEMSDKPAPGAASDAGNDGDDEGAEMDQLDQLSAALNAALETIKKLKGVNDVMMKEKNDAQEAAKLAEKEAKFAVMLTEGKVCAAQKDAFIAGDMMKFTELAQKVNLAASGTTEVADVTGDVQDKIMTLADAKVKKESISLGEAVSAVLKENPELAKKYNEIE